MAEALVKQLSPLSEAKKEVKSQRFVHKQSLFFLKEAPWIKEKIWAGYVERSM